VTQPTPSSQKTPGPTDPNYPDHVETVVQMVVPDGYQEAGRLDQYITRFLQNASRTKVQQGIKDGNVQVNTRVVTRVSHAVQAGDEIACTIMRPPPLEIVPEDIPLSVVYEDEHLLVVNKPAGMVVHPAFGNRTGTLVHAVLHHVGGSRLSFEEDAGETDEDEVGLSMHRAGPQYEGDKALRPGIVHRLDKWTSGLLVVAKHAKAHTGLALQFQDRTIRREYQALVWGIPDPASGRIETALARDPRDRKKMGVVREDVGKYACTNYQLEETFIYSSRLSFRLETGRTHQIRVHAQHMGHPIMGDGTYGGAGVVRGQDTARRRAYYRNLFKILPRQALHASTLGFRHPVTSEEIDLGSPLPDDMTSALERLRKGEPA
jgi:23S rRNA pseudouridine1911/1915/1917 synthase